MRLLLHLIFLLPGVLSAQQSVKPNYVKGYFRYPLNIAPRLNANFGEMRPNHFHMGLDLFTLRKENLPIYAAAEGYISRVKIEPGGFGNAIYIAHPNGTSTLYAHMNDFYPALQQYVKQQQYITESWAQDLELPPGLFPVKKGDVIGMSGNTGGSQGPHVHFEIRETATDKCLNPLLWGFNIPDNVPPVIYKVAFYDRNRSIYEQTPVVATAVRTAIGAYKATVPRLPFSRVLVALHATDQMTGVPNNNGVFKATVFENGKALAGFRLDGISYDETRFLNAHIDYKTKLSGGSYIQFLTPVPGDKLTIYPYSKPGAFIELKDSLVHTFRLEVQDPNGNTSNLQFSLQRSAYSIPVTSQPNLMRPDELNVYETEDLELFMPENILYDSIYFRYSIAPGGQPKAYSLIHNVHSATVPVHSNFTIRLRPDKAIPYNLRDRILIRKTALGKSTVKKASWGMGKYSAEFRDFGSFQLIADEERPKLSGFAGSNLSAASKINIYVTDDNSQIRNFRAELDGKWLRFVQRGNTFTYVFDEKCGRGEHQLTISVEDEAGNKTVQTYSFTR
ncbi:MAG TPA: peptidoglycan DD-metalloendopeptidase family protein [Chitinophagaceae bacterium]|nr:peptidoglycan DD-metalloendopeptidase family protein [Chitinophagaceae bacterium]